MSLSSLVPFLSFSSSFLELFHRIKVHGSRHKTHQDSSTSHPPRFTPLTTSREELLERKEAEVEVAADSSDRMKGEEEAMGKKERARARKKALKRRGGEEAWLIRGFACGGS